jgi:hypothetical protein
MTLQASKAPYVLAVNRKPVVGIDPTVVTVGVAVVTHTHHKYCARREKVCTAAGRFRQGEVLQAVMRGPSHLFGQYRVTWQRSTAPVMDYSYGGLVAHPLRCCAFTEASPVQEKRKRA